MTGASVLLIRGPLAPVLSVAAVILISVTRGSATSAMATGFPISIGFAVPIVAILFFILSQEDSVPPKPVVAGDRWRSLSVYCRWFCCFSEVGRGVKLFAKGDRDDVKVSRRPRVRKPRFPFRTDRMFFASRIHRPTTRGIGIGCPLGCRPLPVSLGSADPMTFLAVFCVPNAGNSRPSTLHWLLPPSTLGICQGGTLSLIGRDPLQGQWRLDPPRSERLTHPHEPSFISRTPTLLPIHFCHTFLP